MLKIYNTITRKKETFQPINPPKIGMYVCGMTVYDFCHIGNGRVFVFFDVVAKYLRSMGYDLTYVRNITDIDDKIIKRANETKLEYNAFTQKYIEAMNIDMEALGIQKPTVEPRVSENMAAIIEIIQILLDKGYAYAATNGDIYYDINKFRTYGELAQQDLNSFRAGARVEVAESKRDPLDFVLWKNAKPNEPSWDAPWGKGRPGWHIECSAMSQKYLGKHFDIHGGGADLQFPHHQNEIAQSEAAYDCKFVNYWMHVGFVSVNHEKMSKSRGNFFTIREVLKQYSPEVLRYFLLASHYRSPINYSDENLEMAQAALKRLYTAIRGLPLATKQQPSLSAEEKKLQDDILTSFKNAMDDDFNIPLALSCMFELARHINKLRDAGKIEIASAHAKVLCHEMGDLLGIMQQNPDQFLQEGVDETKITQLIDARNQARANKDWAAADQIRNTLLEMGVIIEDTAQGTTWKKK
jgi:cysteinyl-tRNA synthetase